MEITQEDRQAAASLNPGVARFYLNGGNDHYKIVQAFAAHRIAAEQRIVEWLRNDAGKGSEEGADWASTFADAIEADAYLEPRDPHHRQPAQ